MRGGRGRPSLAWRRGAAQVGLFRLADGTEFGWRAGARGTVGQRWRGSAGQVGLHVCGY